MKFTLDLRRKNTISDQFQAHSWSASTICDLHHVHDDPLNPPVDGPTQWLCLFPLVLFEKRKWFKNMASLV
ncbi:hypothetical protein P8452_47296 [Trifolium repens]|nr:hypothetical protein P8452_47296 [Trifolium repens]